MTQSGSAAKSLLGNDAEMPEAPASNGCSQPTKPEPKWAAHIPTPPKSHNHCAKVLVSRIASGPGRRGILAKIDDCAGLPDELFERHKVLKLPVAARAVEYPIFRVPILGSVNPSPLGDRDATFRECKTRSAA